jgi:hypothetical protein
MPTTNGRTPAKTPAARIAKLERTIEEQGTQLAELKKQFDQLVVQLKMAALQQAMQNPDMQKVIMAKMMEQMQAHGGGEPMFDLNSLQGQ